MVRTKKSKKTSQCVIKNLIKKIVNKKWFMIFVPVFLFILVVWFLFFSKKTNQDVINYIPENTVSLLYVSTEWVNSKDEKYLNYYLNNLYDTSVSTWEIIDFVKSLKFLYFWQIENEANWQYFFINSSKSYSYIKDLLLKAEGWSGDLIVRNLWNHNYLIMKKNLINKYFNKKTNFSDKNPRLVKYIEDHDLVFWFNLKSYLWWDMQMWNEYSDLQNLGMKEVYLLSKVWDHKDITDFRIVYNSWWYFSTLWQLFKNYKFSSKFLGAFAWNSLFSLEMWANNIFYQNLSLMSSKIADMMWNYLTTEEVNSLIKNLSDWFFIWLYNSEDQTLPIGARLIFDQKMYDLMPKLFKFIQNSEYTSGMNLKFQQYKSWWVLLLKNDVMWINLKIAYTSDWKHTLITLWEPVSVSWIENVNCNPKSLLCFRVNSKKITDLLLKKMWELWDVYLQQLNKIWIEDAVVWWSLYFDQDFVDLQFVEFTK